jgi:spermidine synthase
MMNRESVRAGPRRRRQEVFPSTRSGTWCYNFLSDKVDPGKIRTLYVPDGLRYFNRDVYRAAFALPNFLAERLAKGK